MKLVYASLGALSAVSAWEHLLYEAAEEIVGQFFKENDHGFEIQFGDFLNAKFETSSSLDEDFNEVTKYSLKEKFSLTGEVENTITQEFEVSIGKETLINQHVVGKYD